MASHNKCSLSLNAYCTDPHTGIRPKSARFSYLLEKMSQHRPQMKTAPKIIDFYLGTRKLKNSNFCSWYQKTFRSFFNIQNFRLFQCFWTRPCFSSSRLLFWGATRRSGDLTQKDTPLEKKGKTREHPTPNPPNRRYICIFDGTWPDFSFVKSCELGRKDKVKKLTRKQSHFYSIFDWTW